MESIFRSVLELSLPLGLVIAALLLLRPLLQKRYRAKWMYCLWLVIAVRLIVPLNFSPPGAPVQVSQSALTLFRTEGDVPSSWRWAEADALNLEEIKPLLGAGEDLYDRVMTPMKPVLTLAQAAAWVWAGGVCAVLLWEGVSYARFRRRVRRWRSEEEDAFLPARFEALKAELGVKKLTLARCSAISSPMVTGFLRPELLLPANFPCHSEGQRPEESCSGEQILRCAQNDSAPDAVLRHELVHAKRHDLWYKLVLAFARAIHWFNPLVWLLARRAEQDLELSCDEAAVAGMDAGGRAAYGRAILAAVDTALPPERAPLTTYFHSGKKAMLERLGAILTGGARRAGVLLLIFAAALSLSASALFFVEAPTKSYRIGPCQMEIPADISFVESLPDIWIRDGLIGSARLRRVPDFDRMTAPERVAAVLEPHHSGDDFAAYRSPGGLEGVADDAHIYYLSLGGDQVLYLSFYFGPKFDDFFEGRFTRAEADSVLASLRVERER